MDEFAAVCFDLDGTLCVHDQAIEDLWRTSFEGAGVDPTFEPADVAAVDVDALPTVATPREFHEELFAAAAAEAGADPDRTAVEAVAGAYLDAYDPAAVSFRPGAREALAAARELGPVALVTNGDEETQTTKLESLGIRDAFDVEVYCDPRAGVEPKPDPTPLRMAVEGLEVAQEETLMVGDKLAADVAGAHNAGVHSAWVPREEPPSAPDPEPTHLFEEMATVTTLLGR